VPANSFVRHLFARLLWLEHDRRTLGGALAVEGVLGFEAGALHAAHAVLVTEHVLLRAHLVAALPDAPPLVQALLGFALALATWALKIFLLVDAPLMTLFGFAK
jgi:hypothetical protein